MFLTVVETFVSGRLLLLAEGHGKKKLKGLATHPKDPDVYATVGDDAFVRVCMSQLLGHFSGLWLFVVPISTMQNIGTCTPSTKKWSAIPRFF